MKRPHRHRRNSRQSTKRLIMAISAIVIAGLLLLVVTKSHLFQGDMLKGKGTVPSRTTTASSSMIAVFGTDSRDQHLTGEIDSCMLVKVDKQNQHIEVLSIPANTVLQYPDGHTGTLKSALLFGGPRLAVRLLHTLTHQPVSSYVVLHYGSFINLINAIGGVSVDVREPMNYYTGGTGPYSHIHLQAGQQTLNGSEALQFVRFRDQPSGNLGRITRQQNFIKAVLKKLEAPGTITRLPAILRSGWNAVNSNLSVSQITRLTLDTRNISSWSLAIATLPGSNTSSKPYISTSSGNTGGNSAAWKVNGVTAPTVITNLFRKGESKTTTKDSRVHKKKPKKPAVTKPTNAAATPSKSNPNTTAVTQHNMISTTSVNIRSGPGTSYKIIASVKKGDSVTVIGKSGRWYQIIVQGTQTGYIAGWLVKYPPAATNGTSNGN